MICGSIDALRVYITILTMWFSMNFVVFYNTQQEVVIFNGLLVL